MKAIITITIIHFFAIICHGQFAYEYPIKPGTDQWKALKNQKEKVAACQLPDSILESVSTIELLNI